jgi:hypothetical protein
MSQAKSLEWSSVLNLPIEFTFLRFLDASRACIADGDVVEPSDRNLSLKERILRVLAFSSVVYLVVLKVNTLIPSYSETTIVHQELNLSSKCSQRCLYWVLFRRACPAPPMSLRKPSPTAGVRCMNHSWRPTWSDRLLFEEIYDHDNVLPSSCDSLASSMTRRPSLESSAATASSPFPRTASAKFS